MRLTMALQRTAPGRCGLSRWLLPADPPRSQRATLRRPSAVSELESLGVATRIHKVKVEEETCPKPFAF